MTPDLLGTAAPAPAPARRGRPAVYASPAERQAAYRRRLAGRGLTEVRRVVPITAPGPVPLRSAVIDLSEVRRWPGRRT